MLEVYNLLDPKILEKSPAIKRLIAEFERMLPKRFGKPYFIPAPPEGNFEHVLRANCGNQNCSVRATVHLVRDSSGVLRIKEGQPNFDRLQKPCDDCKKI
jgi:hypothetical protein